MADIDCYIQPTNKKSWTGSSHPLNTRQLTTHREKKPLFTIRL
jgi:hypothetical protein